jgi:prepilin-type N-terminal cleavage/methylation domain-containing protein
MKTNRNVFRHPNTRGQQSAFTLLELLVVIATVAILATLMVPALAHTDDNGARMVCMNNLRQMGLAEGMYAADNRDSLPYPNWDGGANAGAPRGWLYSMSSSQGLPAGFPAGQCPNPYSTVAPYPVLTTPVNGATAWQSGAWFQYVRNFKSYLCPVDIENADYKLPPSTGGRNNKLSSYVMNGGIVSYTGNIVTETTCKITDVWNPACYLLWEPDENADGPGIPGSYDYNDGANFPSAGETIGRLHSPNGTEILCVGGNVQFVTVETFRQQSITRSGSGPGGETLAWWFPGSASGN